MKHHILSLLPYVGVLVSAASLNLRQEQNGSVSQCCTTLQQKLPGQVSLPGSPVYQAEESTYYSSIASGQSPACRITPESATDVSVAMTVLTQGKCKFAVRSAGHMPWAGASNIGAPGVTIDLGKLNVVTVLTDKSVARVGPGLRWGPIYDALDAYNVTVVGGRSNTVGVGGYLMGGGISHLNAQHGLAAQNIVNYEIVLANGTIANVNASSHPDLHTALQAGSTNFGIVTRFDLITYPKRPLWGGARTYNISYAPAFLKGTLSFMEKQITDPLAGGAIISLTGNTLAATMAYYNGDGPLSSAFDEILAIPTIEGGDLIRKNITIQNLNALVDGAYPPGRRTIFNVLTIKANVQLALDLNAKSVELFKPFEGKNISWAVTFQPFGKGITTTIAKQPSFQGIETDANLLIFGIAAFYDDPALDEPLNQWAHDTINWGTQTAKERGLFAPWLYLNYALPDQKVYQSFGTDNYERLRRIRGVYDADNVLETLWPGGFKL